MNKLIKKELKYAANIYNSLPVCISSGKGVFVYDTNKKKYFDFISGYSAVNHGHCHPKLVKVVKKQASKLSVTSRAYYNENLCKFSEYICNYFNYDKVIPMNTGVEACETAIKIARKWGYEVKGVKQKSASILICKNNFWGRTISACSSSNDSSVYKNFGPFTPGFNLVSYNNVQDIELAFQMCHNIVGFMFEPIQGEAGVIIPDDDYIQKVRLLCKKYNVLMIADEVQTGLGRTGSILETSSCGVKPDILILGKSLGGGILPMSSVLADDSVMKCMTPGTHGSTYGGNPLACAVAMESLKIIKNEKLADNSKIMGNYFRKNILPYPFIKEVRGKGLMNAIEFTSPEIANEVSLKLLEKGLICKITHNNIIRFLPPLIINKKQMATSIELINNAFKLINI